MFNTVYVPTYEVYTDQKSSRFASGRPLNFNVNKFRASAAATDASSGQCDRGRTGEDHTECDDVIGDSSFELGSQTVVEVNNENAKAIGPCRSNWDVKRPTPLETNSDSGISTGTNSPSTEGPTNDRPERSSAKEACTISTNSLIPDRVDVPIPSRVSVERPIHVESLECVDGTGIAILLECFGREMGQVQCTSPDHKHAGILWRARTSDEKTYFTDGGSESRVTPLCLMLEEFFSVDSYWKDAKKHEILSTVRFIVKCCVNGAELSSDLSVVLEGGSVLCRRSNGSSHGSKTVVFSGMGFTLSYHTAQTVGGGFESCGIDGDRRQKGRGKKFFKNRS